MLKWFYMVVACFKMDEGGKTLTNLCCCHTEEITLLWQDSLVVNVRVCKAMQ